MAFDQLINNKNINNNRLNQYCNKKMTITIFYLQFKQLCAASTDNADLFKSSAILICRFIIFGYFCCIFETTRGKKTKQQKKRRNREKK